MAILVPVLAIALVMVSWALWKTLDGAAMDRRRLILLEASYGNTEAELKRAQKWIVRVKAWAKVQGIQLPAQFVDTPSGKDGGHGPA